jgi:hypothetical protein
MSDDGQWMDLQTVISSAVAMAKSKVGDHQDKALRLLYGLTTRADETVKSEMARVGAIELMASIMDDGIATESTQKLDCLSVFIACSYDILTLQM